MSRQRGHVRKRGASWVVVLSEVDPETGARKRRYHSGYRTKQEAEQARTELLGRMDGATYVPPSSVTLGEYLTEKWLPAVESTLRPATFRTYRLTIEAYVLSRIGRRPLQALSPDMLNALYGKLLTEGGKQGRPLSARTVLSVHRVLRKALQDGLRWGYVARNVADAAMPPKARTHEMRVWDAQELRQFLDHVAEDRLSAMWFVFASTGMRRGEVLGLRWRDVDLDGSQLAIRQTLLAFGGELHFGEPKTKSGRRQIALDSGTVASLRAHRKRQMEERLRAGPAWADSGLVFTDEVGNPLHPDGVTRAFAARAGEAGLPRIRLHDLRHGWATLALKAGVHAKVVSEVLGHSSISLTLDTYSHVLPGMQESAVETVAGLIRGEAR